MGVLTFQERVKDAPPSSAGAGECVLCLAAGPRASRLRQEERTCCESPAIFKRHKPPTRKFSRRSTASPSDRAPAQCPGSQIDRPQEVDRPAAPSRPASPRIRCSRRSCETLDTLRMSGSELLRNYPTPQMVKQMVNGQVPFKTDPDRKLMLTRLVAKYEERRPGAGRCRPRPTRWGIRKADRTPHPRADPRRCARARAGSACCLPALPKDKQDDVIGAEPPEASGRGCSPSPAERTPARMRDGEWSEQMVTRGSFGEQLLARGVQQPAARRSARRFLVQPFQRLIDKGADRYLITEYERDAIRPHVLGEVPRPAEGHGQEPGDAVLPG